MEAMSVFLDVDVFELLPCGLVDSLDHGLDLLAWPKLMQAVLAL